MQSEEQTSPKDQRRTRRRLDKETYGKVEIRYQLPEKCPRETQNGNLAAAASVPSREQFFFSLCEERQNMFADFMTQTKGAFPKQ